MAPKINSHVNQRCREDLRAAHRAAGDRRPPATAGRHGAGFSAAAGGRRRRRAERTKSVGTSWTGQRNLERVDAQEYVNELHKEWEGQPAENEARRKWSEIADLVPDLMQDMDAQTWLTADWGCPCAPRRRNACDLQSDVDGCATNRRRAQCRLRSVSDQRRRVEARQ